MDMKEPLQFNPTPNAIAGVGKPMPDHPGFTVLILVCLILATAAWIFMNGWSINLVASGILAIKLFPPNIDPDMVLLFAVALQSVPALFGLLTPYFFRRWAYGLAWLPVFCVVGLVLLFEGYHSVLAQYKTSAAQDAYTHVRTDIEGLERKAASVSAQIAATYEAKLNSYAALAAASARGNDETGVALCGPICKEYHRKYAVAKSRYSHLSLMDAATPAASSTGADLRQRLTGVEGLSTKLLAAGKDLSTFYKELDGSTPPAMLSDEIKGLAASVQSSIQRFANLHSLTAATLALEQTNAAFAAIWRGEWPDPQARLPVVYGVLPALCVLVLSVFIRVCIGTLAPKRYGLAAVATDIARETLASRMLKQLETLRSRNFVNHIKGQYRRWDR